ncbi:MAG: hypothetical protein JWN11_2155 [Hyphomicrobiales bacterium]|nr:hypothetical protein [Hyphomicrobiales bacterium]
MRFTLIRYQAKPDRAADNRGLIEAVFRELAETGSQDVGYLVLELEDGTFMHLVASPDDPVENPIPRLSAFKAFTANIGDRQFAPALSVPAKVVGNYRMLAATEQP